MLKDFLTKIGLLKDAINVVAGDSSSGDAVMVQDCPRSWWDSFIDGLNRTIRPAMLGGMIFMFVWAAHAPDDFTKFANALSAIPPMGWYIVFTIATSWVVGRNMTDWRKAGTVDPSTVTETPEPAPAVTAPTTGRFVADDAHHDVVQTLPPNNDSIEAWKNASKSASS